MNPALAARLRDAAEWLVEEIPAGTQVLSELEGDVRLDELDLYCVNLMRQAADELDGAMCTHSICSLRAGACATAGGRTEPFEDCPHHPPGE